MTRKKTLSVKSVFMGWSEFIQCLPSRYAGLSKKISEERHLHKLMAFLRDGHLAMLDHLQENGLLSSNNDNTYVG